MNVAVTIWRVVSLALIVVDCSARGPLALPGFLSGRSERQDIETVFAERLHSAVAISSALRLNEIPTNWNQVLPGLEGEAWIRWEQRYLELPEDRRGFKTSLLEKYVFVEPGVAVPDQSWAPGGFILLLQAKPYSGRRVAIWKLFNSDQTEASTFPEAKIEEWFAKAGREIPTPRENLNPVTPPNWKEQQQAKAELDRASRQEFYESQGISYWDLYKHEIFLGSLALLITAAAVIRYCRINRKSD